MVTRNNHGTGAAWPPPPPPCWRPDIDVPDAVARAGDFVHRALGVPHWHLGRGHGPLDPFGWAHG